MFPRAIYGETQYPANVIPDRSLCFISHDGNEYSRKEYYVLCGDCYSWMRSSDGRVPNGAVFSGYTDENDCIYVARAKQNNNWIVGKVSHLI